MSNFSAISWRHNRYDDDDVCYVLDQHAKLGFYSATSLQQHSAGRHVPPFRHMTLILSQPLLLFNAACSMEKQLIPILLVFGLT